MTPVNKAAPAVHEEHVASVGRRHFIGLTGMMIGMGFAGLRSSSGAGLSAQEHPKPAPTAWNIAGLFIWKIR